jgi:hypothetical protein
MRPESAGRRGWLPPMSESTGLVLVGIAIGATVAKTWNRPLLEFVGALVVVQTIACALVALAIVLTS